MQDHPDGITRRAVVAGAAAGTIAMTTDKASAQRLPAPPRAKGPIVWRDMDQEELDDAYDQEVYAPNHKYVNERRDANNQAAIKAIGKPERVAYGAAEIEKLDIYKTKRANAPVNIMLHGGSWRGGTSAQLASIAEVFVNGGAHFVAVDFESVLKTDGNLFPLVDQVRRAVAWVSKNAATFGGDPNQVYLTGHSSGGHLGGCVVITEWAKYGLDKNPLKGALLGSGMYDLKAVRLSKRGDYVKFTDEMEQELSAQRHIDRLQTPITLTHGTLETPEFQRQTREFYEAVKAAGKPVKLVVCKGYNHYETQETLGSPYGFMGRAAFEMMGLKAAV
jgi:arylformamidase